VASGSDEVAEAARPLFDILDLADDGHSLAIRVVEDALVVRAVWWS
jgi:hypothetical protein